MSKVSNCLLMLTILKNGGKLSIAELSERLEVSPRMIRTYKDDLEKAGFYIETIYGKYGGYVYKESSGFEKINFSLRDLQLIETMYLKSEMDRFSKKDQILLKSLIERIRLKTISENVNNFNKNSKFKQEQLIRLVNKNISLNKTITIIYYSNYRKKKATILPQSLHFYNRQYYLNAINTDTKFLRTYPLLEIEKIFY